MKIEYPLSRAPTTIHYEDLPFGGVFRFRSQDLCPEYGPLLLKTRHGYVDLATGAGWSVTGAFAPIIPVACRLVVEDM